MTLYGIAEPETESSPAAAVGIDLGTTHSLVALCDEEGQPSVLPDDAGDVLMPSAVQYLEAQTIVGKISANALTSTKRLMGRGLSQVEHLPFEFDANDAALPKIKTPAGLKSAIDVASDILAPLWARATAATSRELKGAVITVPAYFDETARKATADAAKLAGIPVLRLINEPTAAALAYGFDREEDTTVLVFDFGGGTFDVSILKHNKGVFRVLATAGDTQLGGDDVDAYMASHLQQHWGINTLLDTDLKALRMLCRQAKEQLSEQSEAVVTYKDFAYTFTRDALVAIITPLLERLKGLCDQSLIDAKCTAAAIDEVILVGGSTRLLAVQEAVQTWFNRPIQHLIDPDTIVALGAAKQADLLVGNRHADTAHLLVDVTPLSLGLEMMGGINEKMIWRNTPLPASATQSFTTYQEGQTGLMLHIVQGEREMAADCQSLARCELKNIPPMPAGKPVIEVTFSLDADGLLSVEAQEKSTGEKVSIDLKPSYGLSDEALAQQLSDAITHAKADVKTKQWQTQVVETQQLIDTVVATLSVDGDSLLTPEEKQALLLAIDETKQAIAAQGNFLQLKLALERLEPLAGDYIDKRLQAGLNAVLSGKSIENFGAEGEK